MHRGALRWIVASGFALALAHASPARADEAPPDPTPATKTDSAKPGHARRPVFLGLLAAGFLLIAGLAGANDRIRGDKKPDA